MSGSSLQEFQLSPWIVDLVGIEQKLWLHKQTLNVTIKAANFNSD